MMVERRKYIRLDESLKIRYQSKKLEGFWSGGSIKNISVGGVCFPTIYNLYPGDILKLDIYLPNFPESIKVTGEVVWQKEENVANFRYLVGVKFIDFESTEEDILSNYINRRIEGKGHSVITWIG